MCLKNLDVAAGLVNGARGVVTAMVSNATSGGGKLWPEVKFACGVTQVMTPETWSVLEADSVVAERKQVCAMVCATVCVSCLHARLCQLGDSCLGTKTP